MAGELNYDHWESRQGDDSGTDASLEHIAHQQRNRHLSTIYRNEYEPIDKLNHSLRADSTYPLYQDNRREDERLDRETVVRVMFELFPSMKKPWPRREKVLQMRLEGEEEEVIARQLGVTIPTISKDLGAIETIGKKIVQGYASLKQGVGDEHQAVFHLLMRRRTISEIMDTLILSLEQVIRSMQCIVAVLHAIQLDEIIHDESLHVGLREGGETNA